MFHMFEYIDGELYWKETNMRDGVEHTARFNTEEEAKRWVEETKCNLINNV